MAKTARKRQTREESQAQTRERLLAAASTLFCKHGVEATSLDLVTEEAGYSRGAFYSNFETRDDLVCAVLEREFAQSQRRFEEIVNGESPQNLLAALREYYVSHATDPRGCMLGVAIQMYAFQNSKIRTRIANLFRSDQTRKLEILAQGIKSLARRGVALPAEPETLLLALTSLANGLCISWMVNRESVDASKVREALQLTFDRVTGLSGRK
ncbi:MAG: TetR/AcrR family transcriptional regulator [Bryobacteraceae bacterium]